MNNIFIFILEFLNFYYQVYLDYQLLILFLKILVLHAFFHVLIFDLNSSRDWVFLYLVFRFAQRKRALYLTVSDRFPIFCKNFRKIFGVVCVAAKLKKWINYEKRIMMVLHRIQLCTLLSLRLANSFDELQYHFALLVSVGSI